MRLHHAVHYQSVFTEVADGNCKTARQLERSNRNHSLQAIPLKRVSNALPIVYGCAIAHRLATPSQSAATIASQLVETMQTKLNRLDALPSGVVVQATATGLIQFELGDRAIAAWLDLLLASALPSQSMIPMTVTEPSIKLPSSAIFDVQYAHARCCSLLRLAHREALITLGRLDEAPLYWHVTNPTFIPWLTSTDQLCLDHPADHALLSRLVEALDRLDDSPRRTQRTLRSSIAIAQAMQEFHRVHPLWRRGCRSGTEPSLVVAQLGLLIATQRVLHSLLWDGLHLYPAVEL